MTASKTLAGKLKALLPARGWDQAELARRSGIKANSISRYLAGLNTPRPAQLAKLAAALEVEVRDLLMDEPTAPAEAAANLLSLTRTSAASALVRLQVDQLLPAELAMRIVALLLQDSTPPAETEDASTAFPESRNDAPTPAKPQPRKGTLADVLLPHAPQTSQHARQVLRLDALPQRSLNGATRA
jgi:transcriptional regulator with XRE-family HTH domain